MNGTRQPAKRDAQPVDHRQLFSAAESAELRGDDMQGARLRIQAHVAAKKRLRQFADNLESDGIDNLARGLRGLARLEQKGADAIRGGDVERAKHIHEVAVQHTQASGSFHGML